jgi:hypothetical protein
MRIMQAVSEAGPLRASPNTPSVEAYRRREARRLLLSATAVVLAIALASVVLRLFSHIGIVPAALVLASPVVTAGILAWLWREPVRGTYVLMGAAVVLPIYYRPDLPDYIGNALPFFPDINTWAHTKGFSFSVAEIFMALVVVVWILKGIARRDFKFASGTLMVPLGLYMFAVLAAWVHGLLSGGSFTTSLWEIRGQAYLFVSYILACNLVTRRRQVWTLLYVAVLGAGVRGIEGTLRFFLTSRGTSAQELYPHEQSYFFNFALTLVCVLVLYGGPTRLKRVALALVPFVLMANLANERRAAVAALMLASIVFLCVTFIIMPTMRRQIGLIALVIAVVFPPYYLAYQHQTGTVAVPARAISSMFSPNARDAGSDQYRANEDADIMATMKTGPIIGYGFGKPMLLPYTLPNISAIYVWWNIMPHNSILWVWMRLGTIGYAIFWFLIGLAMLQVGYLARRLSERVSKGLAIFLLLVIMQQVIIAYLDLQWSNWRCLIVTGLLLGLISHLERSEPDEDPEARRPTSHKRNRTWGRRLPNPVALGVQAGRVRSLANSDT